MRRCLAWVVAGLVSCTPAPTPPTPPSPTQIINPPPAPIPEECKRLEPYRAMFCEIDDLAPNLYEEGCGAKSTENFKAAALGAYPKSTCSNVFQALIDTFDRAAIKAKTLVAEYQANEVAADLKYSKKRITVSGKLASVDKGPLGEIFVLVGSGKQFEMNRVRCKAGQEQTQEIAKLQKGDELLVYGTVEGALIGDVLLGDCVLLPR
jgi:hypothetical protein